MSAEPPSPKDLLRVIGTEAVIGAETGSEVLTLTGRTCRFPVVAAIINALSSTSDLIVRLLGNWREPITTAFRKRIHYGDVQCTLPRPYLEAV